MIKRIHTYYPNLKVDRYFFYEHFCDKKPFFYTFLKFLISLQINRGEKSFFLLFISNKNFCLDREVLSNNQYIYSLSLSQSIKFDVFLLLSKFDVLVTLKDGGKSLIIRIRRKFELIDVETACVHILF